MDNTTTNVQGELPDPEYVQNGPEPVAGIIAVNIGEVKDGDTVHIDAETGTVTKIPGIVVSEGLIDNGV